MEVAVVSSVLTHLSLRCIDFFSVWQRQRSSGAPTPVQHSMPTATSHPQPQPSSPPSSSTGNIPSDDNDAVTIAEVEARLDLLRRHARDLSAPATFVESAKLERRANELEKRLATLKSEHGGTNEDDVPLTDSIPERWAARVAERIGSQALSSGSEEVSRRFSAMGRLWMVKVVVRILLFAVVTWFFKVRYGEDVLVFDCGLVRPLHVFLRKKEQCRAIGDNFVCDVGNGKCGMPFYLWLAICNAIVLRTFSLFS